MYMYTSLSLSLSLFLPPSRDEEIIMPDEYGSVVKENYQWKVYWKLLIVHCDTVINMDIMLKPHPY